MSQCLVEDGDASVPFTVAPTDPRNRTHVTPADPLSSGAVSPRTKTLIQAKKTVELQVKGRMASCLTVSPQDQQDGAGATLTFDLLSLV